MSRRAWRVRSLYAHPQQLLGRRARACPTKSLATTLSFDEKGELCHAQSTTRARRSNLVRSRREDLPHLGNKHAMLDQLDHGPPRSPSFKPRYTRSKVRKCSIPLRLRLYHRRACCTTAPGRRTTIAHRAITSASWSSILETASADDFIRVAPASLIKRLAVDHLHLVGDIFDRGRRARPRLWTVCLTYHSPRHPVGQPRPACGWVLRPVSPRLHRHGGCATTYAMTNYEILENDYGISSA